jgi:hypothetical protein
MFQDNVSLMDIQPCAEYVADRPDSCNNQVLRDSRENGADNRNSTP